MRRYRAAFLIDPERMQRVQTCMRFTAEPTITRTLCRFGIQRRLDTLWAWLTRLPNTGALPQTSHIFAIVDSSNELAARRPLAEPRIFHHQITQKGVDCNIRPTRRKLRCPSTTRKHA